MRTPAGKECQYFYGDYHRGRNIEECRLLQGASPPLAWKPSLCSTCPVPDILRANACAHMVLQPRLKRSLPFLKHEVQVQTFCTKTNQAGFDPHIGCGQCHALPFTYFSSDEPPDIAGGGKP
jgi:hypothetical protein